MGIRIDTERVLIWDNDEKRAIPKTKVVAKIVTNAETVLFESAPLFCRTGGEILEAENILKTRLFNTFIE